MTVLPVKFLQQFWGLLRIFRRQIGNAFIDDRVAPNRLEKLFQTSFADVLRHAWIQVVISLLPDFHSFVFRWVFTCSWAFHVLEIFHRSASCRFHKVHSIFDSTRSYFGKDFLSLIGHSGHGLNLKEYALLIAVLLGSRRRSKLPNDWIRHLPRIGLILFHFPIFFLLYRFRVRKHRCMQISLSLLAGHRLFIATVCLRNVFGFCWRQVHLQVLVLSALALGIHHIQLYLSFPSRIYLKLIVWHQYLRIPFVNLQCLFILKFISIVLRREKWPHFVTLNRHETFTVERFQYLRIPESLYLFAVGGLSRGILISLWLFGVRLICEHAALFRFVSLIFEFLSVILITTGEVM